MKLKEDYVFIDFPDSPVTGIGIVSGEYQGVAYHYGKVKIEKQEDMAKVTYDFTIVDSGKYDIDVLSEDKNFHTIMADILDQVILLKLDEENESIRANNSQELTLQ